MKRVLPFVLLIVLIACGTSQGSNGSEPNEGDEEMNDDSNQSEMVHDELEFTSEVVPNEEEVLFKMALTNHTDETVKVSFSSGQKYEIVVTDAETGEQVYKFSEGMMFTQAIEEKEIEPGEALNWEQTWDYKQNGEKVEAKEYNVELSLLPMTINGEKPDKSLFSHQQTFKVPNGEGAEEQAENDENDHFRNVAVEGESGTYKVQGEARVFEGSFHYTVEDGHNILINEQTVETPGEPGWNAFELEVSLGDDDLPKSGVLTLVLYLDGPDGEEAAHHFVTLENFNP